MAEKVPFEGFNLVDSPLLSKMRLLSCDTNCSIILPLSSVLCDTHVSIWQLKSPFMIKGEGSLLIILFISSREKCVFLGR